MEKEFINELGNKIKVKVSEKEIDGVGGILIYISGPNSETENHVTKMEAEIILEGLIKILKKES
jgi:hypothetical protein